MKEVLIIYKSLPQYRYEFFQQLKVALETEDVKLQLIYGKLTNADSLKNDEVEIDWGTFVPNRVFKLGRIELVWQPCLKYSKGKSLIIVEQANRLMINYFFTILRRFSSYKFAFWGHGRNLQDHPESMRNRFKYIFIGKCDWWFAYTGRVKEMLISYHFPQEKITVVQNAIDTKTLKQYYNEITDEELNALRKEFDVTGNNIGIYCGAMYRDKRLQFILDACHQIKQAVPDFHMVFVGSGIDADLIKEAARQNDFIHYVGPKFGKDRVKYFKLASVQLMPGAVGLGILDSFALQTPMITTDLPIHGPEIDYLQNGINGMITKNDFGNYINTVIDTLINKKYLQMTDACKNASDVYTVEKMVENFKNGIMQCLKY